MACASGTRSTNAMSDLKALTDRLDRLEERLAFQDDTIETLNRTITEQWAKIDALTRQMSVLNERLQEAESQMPRPANEPPPHY
jgi:SlyX protein